MFTKISAVCPFIRPSSIRHTCGQRFKKPEGVCGADDQQKTKFGPTYLERIQYDDSVHWFQIYMSRSLIS